MDVGSKDPNLIVANVSDFDRASGSLLERILFNNRPVILLLCLVMTVICGVEAAHTKLSASFSNMIPTHQPYIQNYFKHYDDLQGQGNAVRIVIIADHGTVINAHYLEILKQINDKVYLLPGVNRPFMTSIWTSNERWQAVTAGGMSGGPIMADSYDGSPAQLAVVQRNIYLSGQVGELVAKDFKSSMILAPLLEVNNLTGAPLNYGELAKQLDQIREEYKGDGVTIRIVGFAMVVGALINGITKMLAFFAVSVVITTVILFVYTKCVRSTALVVCASLVAVIWQMGILVLLGYDLTPYSVLVPFLVFAIGMSHGAQKMNGVMQDIGRGTHPLIAARYTFRRLFLAGFVALICDATGFAVLMTIQIEAIRELALIASMGVGLLIFTNLIMLPILLSYTGVSLKAARRSIAGMEEGVETQRRRPIVAFFGLFTQRRYAIIAISCGLVLATIGVFVGRNVQVGDIGQGAPELRQNSQYNKDNAYIINHYSTGNDVFVVMVDTPPQDCTNYDVVMATDDLAWKLDQLPVVQSTSSIASTLNLDSMLLTEDAPKWFGIEPNQEMLNSVVQWLPASVVNFECSFAPLNIYLTDHKATTLSTIVDVTKSFIADPKNQGPDFKMSIAGGNAGIDAATNIVISQANHVMLFLVYGAVIIFGFATFRSWRAVLCAVLPLALTSVLAQALMVWLGIGVKVATLPVTALGVGIGVDYALYVLSIMLKHLRAGETLAEAYERTLLFTGKVVLLTGFTLSAGVITWVFAPIKFQADMGTLLSFMFLWNMLGAIILLPSLAHFLLPERLFRAKEVASGSP